MSETTKTDKLAEDLADSSLNIETAAEHLLDHARNLEKYNLSLAMEAHSLKVAAMDLIGHMERNVGYSADWPIFVNRESSAEVYIDHVKLLKKLRDLADTRDSVPSQSHS